jgi:CubicO group peptidase (beta-lactamase class C family)
MHKTLCLPVVAGVCAMLACGCSSSEAAPPAPAPGVTWPTAAPEEQGFDSTMLAQVVEQIDQQDLPVDSVLVARNGVLILDAYFYPYLGEQAHDLASVTKSVTSTLVGIAVDQGRLGLDQNVVASFPDLVPVPPSDDKADIKLRHLLTMTSGLDCGRSEGEPELREMMGTDHYVKYALELPMATPPGTEFAYCSPGSHLLSAMITDATGTDALDFARENLFDPLDIGEAHWPEDPQGVNYGWGDLQLHPRDVARIGQLFLNAGNWNGVQVVSRSWIADATRKLFVVDADGTGYGYQWWVLAGPFEGLYEARGRGGQAMFVWPEQNVVAVFTGRGVDVLDDVAPLVAAALQSSAALEPNPDAYARLNAAIRDATEPPVAKPFPTLPLTASQISGELYRIEPNTLDVQCISLRFNSTSDVQFELTLGGVGSGVYDLAVGMDGVPRFSETWPTGIPVGITGEWSEPTVFAMRIDEVAGTKHLRIQGDFSGGPNAVELVFTDAGDSFPAETVQGSSVDSCN